MNEADLEIGDDPMVCHLCDQEVAGSEIVEHLRVEHGGGVSAVSPDWAAFRELAEREISRTRAMEADSRGWSDTQIADARRGAKLARALLSALDAAEKQSQAATASQSLVSKAYGRDLRLRTIEGVMGLMRSAGSAHGPVRDAIIPHSNGYSCWFVPYDPAPVTTKPIEAEEILRRIEAREALDTDHGAAVVPKGSDRPALDALEQAGGGSKSESGSTAEPCSVVRDRNYVCDCGATRVVVYPPATYPYSEDSAQVQCNSCGTYVKDDDLTALRHAPSTEHTDVSEPNQPGTEA